MIRRHHARAAAVCLAAALASFRGGLRAEPTPEQEAYWWLDEIRTVAFALSTSRTGRVAQWPRMTVRAGSGTLPLPRASGPIVADGRLDEPAWGQATSFPVGPLFGPWRDGPLVLQVSACRDEKAVYLAIESPVDLSELGSLAPKGELFAAAGRPYRVGKGGKLPHGAVRSGGQGQVVELAVPVAKRGAAVPLSFAAEVVRCRGTKLPPELACLGLTELGRPSRRTRRAASVWLAPITISLVPADVAARVSWTVEATGRVRLSHKLIVANKEAQAREVPLAAKAGSGVHRYAWQAKWKGRAFQLEGCVYVEPVAETLSAAHHTLQRALALGSKKTDQESFTRQIAELEGRAKSTSPKDRKAWRQLYCRARELRARIHLSMLDAPLLFVKQHPYFAAHIYDDYYTWHPGGGIYVLENPHNPRPRRDVRAVIDPKTKPTLGGGVYRDAELSWDAKRMLFAHKSAQGAWTSIYEIGIDGRGLRRLTKPEGYHDITPCYLPDGRIVFTSTRPRGRVPCFNSGVDTLHIMNADGSGIRSISYNNVTEFDPAILSDGRILYGRWEYLDKTALYMQSLWTMFPDGTHETALFANNLAKPTAVLDARPVPGTGLVVASLTPHNGQAVGAIGMIDIKLGKNNLADVFNFTPEYPKAMDQGLAIGPCDPWALSKDDVLISNNAIAAHGIIELLDRFGNRELVHCEPQISCYAPMLVKPAPAPHSLSSLAGNSEPGRFLILNIYDGLKGVPRGTVKRLRVIEETARTSEVPPGGRWWNQAFLISWQGAYVVKTFLGTVPVYPDGSAYFEAPPARALYFEALDEDGREIHRMRTYVQAVPGVTRSCIGCHEHKFSTPSNLSEPPQALLHPPAGLQPESWGSGFIDYPTMIQPVLDKHCVRCHGGPDDIAGGHDLSGGWTWAFNISYETLLKNNLVGFVRCNNADVTSSVVLPPRKIGSGAAPLGKLLLDGHKERTPKLARAERDLLMAWMDGNSNYYGTWDYTPHANCAAILGTAGPLSREMRAAGCTKCHAPNRIGNDWVNLQKPQRSRILRAPLVKTEGGLGLAWCRERKAKHGMALVTQRYLPPDVFRPPRRPKRDPGGKIRVTFKSSDDPRYQAMLKIIRQARAEALARPRVDMPGAQITVGECRLQVPMPLPDPLPALTAALAADSVVELSWPRNAATIGLDFELHRDGRPDFEPAEKTRLGRLRGFRFTDHLAPAGERHYALVLLSGDMRSAPARAAITVPPPAPPPAPAGLRAASGPGQVALEWKAPVKLRLRYHVYRAKAGATTFKKITDEPPAATTYFDTDLVAGVKYAYVVRAVSRRGAQSKPTPRVVAAALPETKEPLFAAPFDKAMNARLFGGGVAKGRIHGRAKVTEKTLDLRQGGHVTFRHRAEFDLRRRLSVECWVYFEKAGSMPVILSCGRWNGTGWFLQRFGGGWRWHVAGVDCDGGKLAVGRWIHLVATFDGRRARVFQDGAQVASSPCNPDLSPWPGPLFVGQYGPSPGAQYQVEGRIAGVKLYRRAVPAAEAAALFKAGRP